MAEPILAAEKEETTATNQLRIACDGPATSKHPRVYLTMVDDENGNPSHVVCPYCSKTYIYTGV